MKILFKKGQTAVEYLLISLALTVTFAIIYKILHGEMRSLFRGGGVAILKMYKVDPW